MFSKDSAVFLLWSKQGGGEAVRSPVAPLPTSVEKPPESSLSMPDWAGTKLPGLGRGGPEAQREKHGILPGGDHNPGGSSGAPCLALPALWAQRGIL